MATPILSIPIRRSDLPEKYIQRFHERYEKTASGCWEWTRRLTPKGYGQICIKKWDIVAHRFSFVLHVRDLEEGEWVLHKCDNRRCVNPEHLFVGDVILNTADMVSKGRQKGPWKIGRETCFRGHPWTPENTIQFTFTYRHNGKSERKTRTQCKTCRHISANEARKRAIQRNDPWIIKRRQNTALYMRKQREKRRNERLTNRA